ncbi:hypothetical protein D3C71_1877110 [compost metagenome]
MHRAMQMALVPSQPTVPSNSDGLNAPMVANTAMARSFFPCICIAAGLFCSVCANSAPPPT